MDQVGGCGGGTSGRAPGGFERLRGKRARVEVALEQSAAVAQQEILLAGGFHAFRHGVQAKHAGQVEDGGHHRLTAFGVVERAGGVDVEAFQDRAVALPPLNRLLAQDLIRRTRMATLLGAFRNRPPVDMAALENVLLRLSEMVCELPWLAELDINPLLVDETGALALDARIVIAPRVPTADRYGHMAIHPYPSHLVTHWQLPSGHNVVIRPIRPEDAELTQGFVKSLSVESRYFRFMDALAELPAAELARLTQIDYTREMALLALTRVDGRDVELGVARYAINVDGESCEFALVVNDAWQKQGIGHKLMDVLMDVARGRGLKRMEGEVLKTNRPMLKLVEALGFRIEPHPEDESVRRVARAL